MNISDFSQQFQSMKINIKSINYSVASQLFNKHMPGIVSAALVIILAQSMAELTWNALPETPYEEPPDISVNQRLINSDNRGAASNANAYSQITKFHLFGIARNEAIKPTVAAPVAQEAPDTQLNLTLKGVVASDDIMDAWAIIADRMGNDESYTIDEILPGGAVLKEIYTDRIILFHNGRLETLRLPQTEVKGNNRRNVNNRRSNSRVNSRRSNRSSRSANVNRLSFAATQTLKSYRDKLLNDPQSVMNSVRAEPYRQAGKLKGYRIFPGRDKQLFGQMGLEPGDIVTSVNGIELDSPLKGLEIMQQLSNASNVSVSVLRNGVTQSFESSLN